MPYIKREDYDRLLLAGNIMSNLCFNLSQTKDNKYAYSMKESYEKWDYAKRRINNAKDKDHE